MGEKGEGSGGEGGGKGGGMGEGTGNVVPPCPPPPLWRAQLVRKKIRKDAYLRLYRHFVKKRF